MADQLFKIPLANTPQKFTISLNAATYNLVSKWNSAPEGGWVLDFYDENDNPIIMNVPLVTGANLLEQYEYVGIAGILAVITDGDDDAVPTLDNLGNESNLYYLVDITT